MKDVNCMMLLTEDVKPKMKVAVGNLVGYGVDIVGDLREIKPNMLRKSHKLVILGTYAYDGLDYLKLFKEILKLDLYLITDDELLISLVSNFITCYRMDYTMINNDMLSSVIYGDSASLKKYAPSESLLTKKDYLENILNVSDDELLTEVVKDNLKLREILELKNVDENKYRERIRQLESEVKKNQQDISVLSRDYAKLVGDIIEQNKILDKYKIILSKDLYDKVLTVKYPNKPLIIYFKEYQELIYEYSFLTTLRNMINIQCKKSCKILRLHDSYDVTRIKSLENDYGVIGGEFFRSDVVASDMLLSYGNYKKLLDLLLTNDEHLDVLVIVDCKKYDDVVISGSDVIYFNMCRSVKVANYLGKTRSNTITNDGGGETEWSYYPNYKDFKTDKDRFEYLAARPVMQKIYSLVTSGVG